MSNVSARVVLPSAGGRVDLGGVPETMLWPLWNRAYEARRRDRLIDDPLAIDLVKAIDYDFRRSFGLPNRGFAIRARTSDDLLRSFLAEHAEGACVVALGEGLDTAFWRLGEPDVPWLSVDVAEAIAVRQKFLPEHPSIRCIPCSALDLSWIDELPPGSTPFISAPGLLMYFQASEVHRLLAGVAERCPGAELFFDTIPPLLSAISRRGLRITPSYKAPRMPWGLSSDAVTGFLATIPGLKTVRVQTYAEPFPSAVRPFGWVSSVDWIRRNFAPSLVHARVAGG